MRLYCQACGFASTYQGVKPLSCEACDELFSQPPARPKPAARPVERASEPAAPARRSTTQERFHQMANKSSDFDFDVTDLDLSPSTIRTTITPVTKISTSKASEGNVFNVDESTPMETRTGGHVTSTRSWDDVPVPIEQGPAGREPKTPEEIKRDLIAKMLKPDPR